jgi:hypothetical protein
MAINLLKRWLRYDKLMLKWRKERRSKKTRKAVVQIWI